MLSPLELENKRILTNKRKYDKLEMDEYLDMVFENYKALFNENEELKKQIKTLTEGIQYYRSIESTMQKALVLAEKTSKETKDAAALKAESIEKDANNRAAQIIGTAEAEYTRIREKCLALVQQFNQYKAQLQVAANEQLRLITSATFEVETPEIDNQAVSEPVNIGTGMDQVPPAETVNTYTEPTAEPNLESTGSQEASVYSFTSSGNTQPLPDLSLFQPDVAPFAPPQQAESEPAAPEPGIQLQPQMEITPEPPAPEPGIQLQPQMEITPEPPGIQLDPFKPATPESKSDDIPVFTFDNDPVPDKTMVLPDVKSVDREALRGNKPAVTPDVLTAETINLEDSIREVRGREQEEPLQVPKREEPQVLQIEPEPAAQPRQAQGLDSILQNITIGKKKKNTNGGDTQEDPFEFLGSVDDF